MCSTNTNANTNTNTDLNFDDNYIDILTWILPSSSLLPSLNCWLPIGVIIIITITLLLLSLLLLLRLVLLAACLLSDANEARNALHYVCQG